MTENNDKLKANNTASTEQIPLPQWTSDGFFDEASNEASNEVSDHQAFVSFAPGGFEMGQKAQDEVENEIVKIHQEPMAELKHQELLNFNDLNRESELSLSRFQIAEDQGQLDGFEQSLNGEGDLQPDLLEEGTATARSGQLDLSSMVEAILFATSKPLKVGDILEILADETITSKDVSEVISSLVRFYKSRQGGFRLENIRGGYQFQTVPEAGDVMEKMFSSRPRPISRAAQETLAIIAYRQPVTRADIEFIRGVDAGSIMKNLLERNLIKCVGRKEDSGRPMLFGTTDEFLSVYGLNSLGDLPPLESFQPSHEIMKNALQSIEEGDQLDDTNDFVGNYDERADPANELEASEDEVYEADFPITDPDDREEVWAKDEALENSLKTSDAKNQLETNELQVQPMGSTKAQRIKGASKIDKQGSETTPQGVFLGGIDGGFNDDEIKEENEY